MKDTKNTQAAFAFRDDVTVLCCTTCDATVKKGPQFDIDEVYAAMGKRGIEGQNCRLCKFKGHKIYYCTPGTVEMEDTDKPVKLTFYERNDATNTREVGTLVGQLMVPYSVWDKMDAESLAAAEPMFSNSYVTDHFDDIEWYK